MEGKNLVISGHWLIGSLLLFLTKLVLALSNSPWFSFVPAACAWKSSASPAPFPAPQQPGSSDDPFSPLETALDDFIYQLVESILAAFPQLQDVFFPQDLGFFSYIVNKIASFLFIFSLFLVGSDVSLADVFDYAKSS